MAVSNKRSDGSPIFFMAVVQLVEKTWKRDKMVSVSLEGGYAIIIMGIMHSYEV